MSHVVAGNGGEAVIAGVAGEQFTAAPGGEGIPGGVAGEQFTAAPGGEGIGAVGGGGFDDVLPFTGSVFTLPIALLGLALTAGGWFLTRFSIEHQQ